MTTAAVPSEQRFLLDNVDWRFYESLLTNLGDRHVFVTYDRGRVELMSPSWKHDKRARRIGLLVGYIADALSQPLEGGGTTTFRREDLDRGLEPDQCFYIANASRIRGKDEIDLALDPPPDLAVEVEITHRLLDREAIYAALGIPELWVDDGQNLRIQLLDAAKQYRPAASSLAFPSVQAKHVVHLLGLSQSMDEMSWGRAVREWLKANLTAS
jgi:Uma2 family endonuclease